MTPLRNLTRILSIVFHILVSVRIWLDVSIIDLALYAFRILLLPLALLRIRVWVAPIAVVTERTLQRKSDNALVHVLDIEEKTHDVHFGCAYRCIATISHCNFPSAHVV